MELITFYCRGEPLTLSKHEIESLSDSEWFISLLIKYNDNDEKTELCEDINIVRSIIETLRYKKIVMYKNISFSHMKLLCDKWCVPDWIIKDIEIIEKKQIEIIDTTYKDDIDEFVYQCLVCRGGFKKSSNLPDSCQFHRLGRMDGEFNCCNKEDFCVKSYHTHLR